MLTTGAEEDIPLLDLRSLDIAPAAGPEPATG
jgi:hypothetical protein